MKAQKKILKEMVEGIKRHKVDLDERFDDFKKQILDSKTAEQVMKHKKEFLMDLIEIFPLWGDTCYFCILNNGNCDVCQFANFHKKCDRDDKSDYNKILDSLDEVKNACESYYRGETYSSKKLK